jgi:predicted nucleic acid-binding protein
MPLARGLNCSFKFDETVGDTDGKALVAVVPLYHPAAGEKYATLMIGNNDLWIAAHALAAGFILVTNNEKELP